MSISFRFRPRRILLGLLGTGLILSAVHGRELTPAPAMVDASGEPAAAPAPEKWDILIYNDGDRTRGHLLRRENGMLVFQSVRFGELRVPASEAMIETPDGPPSPPPPAPAVSPAPPAKAVVQADTPPTPAPPSAATEEAVEAEDHLRAWEYFYPTVLARQLRDLFGAWQGRFAFSTEIVSDTTDHSDLALDLSLHRKWTRDDLQLTTRYDYAESAKVTTTDLAKANAAWRHDLNKRWFTTYNPAVEWNRIGATTSADYLLLHQELGAGVTLLNRDKRQLRVGLSENRFDVWQTDTGGSHSSENSESAFVEAVWQLPWRITLNERGVYYFQLNSERDGWENHFEVNKKLTETLSIGVLHEVRYNNPDVRVTDYSKLKFMLGLDF